METTATYEKDKSWWQCRIRAPRLGIAWNGLGRTKQAALQDALAYIVDDLVEPVKANLVTLYHAHAA